MNPNCQLKSNYRQQREQTPAVIKAKCQRTEPSLLCCYAYHPAAKGQTHISARDTVIKLFKAQSSDTYINTHSIKLDFFLHTDTLQEILKAFSVTTKFDSYIKKETQDAQENLNRQT